MRGAGVPVIIFVTAPLCRGGVPREHGQRFNAFVPAHFAYNLLRALFVHGGRGYNFAVLHRVGNRIVGGVATRAFMPMPVGVVLPFARKVVAELCYRLCALFFAQGARIGHYAVLRAGCGRRNLAPVPHVFAFVFAAAARGKPAKQGNRHYGGQQNFNKFSHTTPLNIAPCAIFIICSPLS